MRLAKQKGYTEEEGKNLFLQRMTDEYQAVALSAVYAGQRINSEARL